MCFWGPILAQVMLVIAVKFAASGTLDFVEMQSITMVVNVDWLRGLEQECCLCHGALWLSRSRDHTAYVMRRRCIDNDLKGKPSSLKHKALLCKNIAFYGRVKALHLR